MNADSNGDRRREQIATVVRKLLGSLELEVMEYMWHAGEATVGQVTKAADKLNQHLQEVREYGIDGVPTSVIGNKMVVGAQPYQVLEKVLNEELPSGSRAGKTG